MYLSRSRLVARCWNLAEIGRTTPGGMEWWWLMAVGFPLRLPLNINIPWVQRLDFTLGVDGGRSEVADSQKKGSGQSRDVSVSRGLHKNHQFRCGNSSFFGGSPKICHTLLILVPSGKLTCWPWEWPICSGFTHLPTPTTARVELLIYQRLDGVTILIPSVDLALTWPWEIWVCLKIVYP